MLTKAFQECLIDVHRGEVLGEAAFESMLGAATNAQERYVIGSLLQLETEGKAIVRPLLVRLGLSVLDPDGHAAGSAGGEQLSQLPWIERFAALRDLTKANYLPRYLELATLVSADEEPEAARIAAFMGTHERAVVEIADNIVGGKSDPAAPVVALLHFPLPRLG